MAREFDDIERDAMQLSLQDRSLLAERLLATLDPGDDVDAEELWLQEAEWRYHRVPRRAQLNQSGRASI